MGINDRRKKRRAEQAPEARRRAPAPPLRAERVRASGWRRAPTARTATDHRLEAGGSGGNGDGGEPPQARLHGASRRRRARGAREAQAEEAPRRAGDHRAQPAGPGLVDLRDHDGGRPGPAEAREPRPVRARGELRRLRPRRRPARHAHQQRGPHPGRVRRDRPGDEGGGRRDRGPALLRPPRRRLPGHRSRALPGRALRLGLTGSVDDHAAVREERPGRAGRPDDLPEAPRGRARLPARAQLVEGQDHHRVPELDLLRGGRLRDRGRGPHLLRLRARGLRPGGAAHLRVGAPPVRGRAPGRDHRLARRLLAARQPGGRRGPAQPGPPEHGRAGVHHLRGVHDLRRSDAASGVRDLTPGRRLGRPLLHLLAAPAAGRQVRRRRGVRRRPRDQVHARPRVPAAGRGDRREHRGGRRPRVVGGRARQRDGRRAGDGRQASTTRRPPSTSPPTDCASPAQPSSRSP